MKSVLKEALMLLCGENRWSYAVFWKIGCQNPTLLIWEDYHYQPTQKSLVSENPGIDSTELLLKEWEGLWGPCESHFSGNGSHAEDKVCLLINRMMINNHVHVVGEGIVGRAAFTGNHQWILQENCMGKHYPSEVMSEVLHQFSAGMQTVTAIPVLPHGVLQLGSRLTIAENIGFVNDVKSLFAQLGGAPAAVSSDYVPKRNIGPKTGASPSLGIPITMDSARESCFQGESFLPFVSPSFNQETSTSQAKGLASQLAHSLVTQTRNYTAGNTSASKIIPCLSSIVATSGSNSVPVNPHRVIKPNLPLRGQLDPGTVGAQVIISSPDAQLKPQASSHNSSTRFSGHPLQSGSPWTNLKFMEPQILSCSGLHEHANSILSPSINTNISHRRTSRGIMSNSSNDSVIVSLCGGSELPNAGNGLQTLTSVTSSCPISSGSAESNAACLPRKDLPLSSSDTSATHVSKSGDLSNNRCVLLGVPERTYTSTNNYLTGIRLAEGKRLMENDLFQAVNMPSASFDNQIPRSVLIPESVNDCPLSSLKHEKESLSSQNVESLSSQNVICEDSCEPLHSADDLFDILGQDYKSREVYGTWNSSLLHGADMNMSTLSVDASTYITQAGAAQDFYAVNEGISERGNLNQRVSDHLLDAVVSKVQSGAKQNPKDDMSCWTMLSTSSSAAPIGAHAKVPDQKQGKSFCFPPPHAKSQITGSSSLITGCSKDTVGESSHINSTYGPQNSLVGEDSQLMKSDNSISTAHSKKLDELGKVNRKRLRPGENPRPRPKDRQMIQDRLKELREIVPNGGKCSIDALLERTIKHMLFLQSVTKHAEKLKQSGESKIISKDGGLFLKDNFEGGATWAFEVGSPSMACPIIVEDLNPPRQMLVEMLCVEQGLFLEIADIIRGLGLTILKGVMEARNDKVWVRFTVEANRDVTRMEIFLSLVHLLEQSMKNSGAATKSCDEGNLMAQNAFHQVSVPVTGQSVGLQ